MYSIINYCGLYLLFTFSMANVLVLVNFSLLSVTLRLSAPFLFKVNRRNTRSVCYICSKLTAKTPEENPCNILRLTWSFIRG